MEVCKIAAAIEWTPSILLLDLADNRESMPATAALFISETGHLRVNTPSCIVSKWATSQHSKAKTESNKVLLMFVKKDPKGRAVVKNR